MLLEERDVLLQGIVNIFYINKMFATGMHQDATDFHHYLMFFKDSSGTIIVIWKKRWTYRNNTKTQKKNIEKNGATIASQSLN